jgi:hypothetical protein
MSTSTAPMPIDLCEHLLDNLHQPLALVPDPSPAYLCASCVANEVEQRLLLTQSPAAVAESLYFNCDHSDGCIACREGIVAALKVRRWAAFFSESSHGNRIADVIKRLVGTDIPAPISMAKRTAPKKRKVKKYWGGRTRWEDEREPIPSALCKPPYDVVVISPGPQAVSQ